MDALEISGKLLTGRASGLVLDLATSLLYRDRVRQLIVRLLDGYLGAQLRGNNQAPVTRRAIARERQLLALAVLHTVDRVVQRRFLSPQVARVIAELWGRTLCLSRDKLPAVQRFHEEYGCDPPWFITISPGHACNLRCPGCYANSGLKSAQAAAKLDWSTLDRIMTEAKELWGVGLFVFSGGEPLLYRSEGKDLLDVVEKHSDSLFLMFTNGTLIDMATAARLARLGNLTPAISIEGLRSRTDKRRGRGIFDRLAEAMSDLREAGVPFGISATVTRSNCEEILSDEFHDFFFAEQGAFYGFLFQYLPIGQSLSLEPMLTHEQRLNSWRRAWEVIESKRIFIFDFWNHGPLVDGCLSAGRQGGYVYIDWNGKVMPCVFAPYSVANIGDIYAQGGTLNDVWKAPFFEAIRRWQRDYGYGREELSAEGNWLSPCPVRDHYGLFRQWLERYRPESEDEAAEQALLDGQYYEEMVAYGAEYREFSQEIWEQEYLDQKEN